ncbi:GatB/YqeY domain-containing protein [Patescibacteria group bacterium]
MLHTQIKEDMKDAMRAKEELKLMTLRGLLSAFTNELVTQKKKPSESLDDESVLMIINRAAKQRKDAIEQFEKGGRPELAESEKAELEIIQAYLPQMMSVDEIRPIAEAKKTEMGIDDKSKAGQLMGAVMKELKGKADGGDVKKVVEELLG